MPVISQGSGADPAAVAYDTLKSAIARKADVVIIDTAGRLHNRINLMNELGKIRNVLKKLMPEAPQEVLLVLDATTGQNAIEQARQFSAATDVTALAVTKLDGTAKGGVVIGISDQFQIPVRYIGVGEKMEQLQVFNREAVEIRRRPTRYAFLSRLMAACNTARPVCCTGTGRVPYSLSGSVPMWICPPMPLRAFGLSWKG